MDLSEFQAWFDDYTEEMKGPPSKEQWAKIKKRVAEITPDPTPAPIFIERPPVAKEAAANVRSVLTPPDKPYSELGSIEGTARSIDRDGRGHLILYIHGRLTGEEIKCFVSGAAAEDLGEHQIRDVWRGHRVQVYGTLHYKGLGKLNQVEAIRVRFLRDRSDLPSVEDIVDPDFTGGLKSEDYLARLRDGEPN